ncbi:MAG TPA: YdiU family protein [Alphaproteobacteria bacterium]|nr:YdiU family protein [Alphaproteobacteria bacterium]
MPVDPAYAPAPLHPELGPAFFDPVDAAGFPSHVLRYRNDRWAGRVGLAGLSEAEWIAHFGRFEPLPENIPQPLALRYHGHQFRSYNPDLGDGRGFLFAQLRDAEGRLLDLATKGSGETPYSRQGDGRLTLKGGVREILATEMLEALGVYTSKTFSLVETGESLYRGDEPSPTRSSVLVRLGHSHIRFGTFQRLAYHDDSASIAKLVDYTIRNYMPDAWRDDQAERMLAFLERVLRNVAEMGAQWMAAGFVHGVLNTDNTVVTGESFDYGPWRFLPHYDPAFTAAYFDHSGLYAFARQPEALFWNLCRLAECLGDFVEIPKLEAVLMGFREAYPQALVRQVLRRLGLAGSGDGEADMALVRGMFEFLHDSRIPYERFFFDWHGGRLSESRAAASPEAARYASDSFAALRGRLLDQPVAAGLRLDHPYFAGAPCTMLIDEVEAIWAPIAERDDWSALHAKLERVAAMREAYGVA